MNEKEMRELDFEVATKVFGWKCETCLHGFKKKFTIQEWTRLRAINPDWPKNEPDLKCNHHAHYSTDPAASLEVLKRCAEKLSKDCLMLWIRPTGTGFIVGSRNYNYEVDFAESKTLELAIAIFAKALFTPKD